LLPVHHYGGPPGRSTEDAMLVLSESIHKAWREKKVYSALFLDIAGAFNNVYHKRLVYNLRAHCISPAIVNWLKNFLYSRSTKLHFNGRTSETINTMAGVPQGSPLSLLLYMYYNAGLLEL
jgi:retron-type reverse transcriptase